MKRNASNLVSYSSSDDDQQRTPPPKKRKLPALSSSLIVPAPIDNPALHQGRIRTKPYVDGQFAAYIYVPLLLESNSPLSKFLDDVLESGKEIAPTLHEFGPTSSSPEKHELHVSLSRPISLRSHQREDLKRCVKALAKHHSPFKISFAAFSELTNDECTRTFLTMEVGAGHHELRTMSDALTPTLQAIRQKSFYTDPRFHASIAWALLDPPALRNGSSSKTSTPPERSPSEPLESSLCEGPTESINQLEFSTIPHFPSMLIPTLNDKYSSKLASTKVGTVDVEKVHAKIGKEVYSWHLTGQGQ